MTVVHQIGLIRIENRTGIGAFFAAFLLVERNFYFFPPLFSYSVKKKMSGNSASINLIIRIFENIFKKYHFSLIGCQVVHCLFHPA